MPAIQSVCKEFWCIHTLHIGEITYQLASTNFLLLYKIALLYTDWKQSLDVQFPFCPPN